MARFVVSPVTQKRAGARCMHPSWPLFSRCAPVGRHLSLVDAQPHWENEGWPGPWYYLGLCKFVKSPTHPNPSLGPLCSSKWITATSTVTTWAALGVIMKVNGVLHHNSRSTIRSMRRKAHHKHTRRIQTPHLKFPHHYTIINKSFTTHLKAKPRPR